MSQSSSRQVNPVELQESRLELSRGNSMRDDTTSLRHEVHETVRRLLQHIVLVSLLALRLYMLPLLYISNKLANRDDLWYLATRSFVTRPARPRPDCAQCWKRDGRVSFSEPWSNIRERFFAPIRIFKTLYSLGQMIGEDPNALQPTSISMLNSAPDSAVDVQSLSDGNGKDFGADSTESQLEAPASASQIYHAALLNGSTLDDILAAFEANDETGEIKRVMIQRSQLPRLPAEQQSSLAQYARHRFRSASIQTTPERGEYQKNTEDVESHQKGIQKPPETPSRRANGPLVRVKAEDGENSQVVARSPVSCTLPCSGGDLNGGESRTDLGHSEALKRCPTFVRRHNQSQQPRRSISGGIQQLTMLQERGAMSTPALPLRSPTKRARLQRRIKVYQDPGKSIND